MSRPGREPTVCRSPQRLGRCWCGRGGDLLGAQVPFTKSNLFLESVFAGGLGFSVTIRKAKAATLRRVPLECASLGTRTAASILLRAKAPGAGAELSGDAASSVSLGSSTAGAGAVGSSLARAGSVWGARAGSAWPGGATGTGVGHSVPCCSAGARARPAAEARCPGQELPALARGWPGSAVERGAPGRRKAALIFLSKQKGFFVLEERLPGSRANRREGRAVPPSQVSRVAAL